jgi:hypothetical protein
MNTLTKLQKTILTIYAGSAYSSFRDNNLTELEAKAKKYLDKSSNKPLERHGGGCALNIMHGIVYENLDNKQLVPFNPKEIDDISKKAWLSVAIGFEITYLILTPKILLPILRLFYAPSIKDAGFAAWVAKYKEELSLFVSLIDGLENLQGCDIYDIIFKEL